MLFISIPLLTLLVVGMKVYGYAEETGRARLATTERCQLFPVRSTDAARGPQRGRTDVNKHVRETNKRIGNKGAASARNDSARWSSYGGGGAGS